MGRVNRWYSSLFLFWVCGLSGAALSTVCTAASADQIIDLGAPAELSQPVSGTETALSRTVEGKTFLYAVYIEEIRNKPCQIAGIFSDMDGGNRETWSGVGPSSNANEKPVFAQVDACQEKIKTDFGLVGSGSKPWKFDVKAQLDDRIGLYVTQLRVCQNARNDRVKGVRVVGTGPAAEMYGAPVTMFDEDEQPNCNKWGAQTKCREGHAAAGLKVYLSRDGNKHVIKGLQLSCRPICEHRGGC